MSDYFFYDINKKMADLANKQQLTEDAQAAPDKPATSALRTQLNERDMGKHNNATTGFAALAKKTGGGEKGAKIAGAQLAKMRAKGQVEEGSKPDFLDLDKDGNRKEPMRSAARSAKKVVAEGVCSSCGCKSCKCDSMDESALQAAFGRKKYTKPGMQELQRLGRIGASEKTKAAARKKFDQYDEGMTDEGNAFSGAVIKAKADGIQPGEKIRVGGKQYPVREQDMAEGRREVAKGTPDDIKLKIKKLGLGPYKRESTGSGGEAIFVFRNNPDYYISQRQDGDWELVRTNAEHNLPEDKSDAASDAREALATKIYDLSMLIHNSDRMYASDSPQDNAKLKQLQAVWDSYYPGQDAVKIGSHFSKFQRRQQQRQQAASKPKGIMQKAKNAISGMFKEDDIPMTAKQKSFAALAPPVNKITFADKIVGAKKEVDEMLGDVAASAMKKAVRGRNRDMEEGHFDDTPTRRRSSSGGEIDTSTPGVTRHTPVRGNYSGAGHDVGGDNEPTGAVGRRKVGAGQGKKIGAKINRGTSKLMTREGDMPEDMFEPQDSGEYDQEGSMAKDDIKTVVRHAQALEKILGDNDNLPEWVQSKLAKIESMMTAVDDYMQNQETDQDDEKMQEASNAYTQTSGYPAFKKKKPASKEVAKDIEYDEKEKDGIHGKMRGGEDNNAEKAGKKVAKDIEYDKKKDKKKEVDETTTSGSVSTGAATTSSGGHSYGKGIYDSMNRNVEKMISESMSINMSMNNDSHGGPSNTLTVTATDEDAKMLAGLLKMAGLGHGDDHINDMTDNDPQMLAIQTMGNEEACSSCGSSPCGCNDQMMDEAYGDTDATENDPDYPTDEVGTDDAMMYSGGLNGPKSTGQTTAPVNAGQKDRMGHAGDHELRRMMEIAGLREAVATPQAVDEPTNTKAKPETPGSRIKVDPNYKPNAKAAAPASKTPPKIATPQAVNDPSTKIKEGLLMQLRNFKY